MQPDVLKLKLILVEVVEVVDRVFQVVREGGDEGETLEVPVLTLVMAGAKAM